MGNAARKARKRDGIKFVRAVKVGTPVLERAEMQDRPIYGRGMNKKVTRYGVTSRVKAALAARGIHHD